MKVVCNGEEREIAQGTSIALFLRQLGLQESTIVVECDGRIVSPDEFSSLKLHEGARLELIRFVGGG